MDSKEHRDNDSGLYFYTFNTMHILRKILIGASVERRRYEAKA